MIGRILGTAILLWALGFALFAGTLPRPAAEIDKEIPIHGVSVIEVKKNSAGKFEYDKASSYNRRITPLTPSDKVLLK